MKSNKKEIVVKIIITVSEFILSLLSFILVTKFDPLYVSDKQSLASIPAFFISVIIILIGNSINNILEIHRSNNYYKIIHNDVNEHHQKISDTMINHLNVISIGSPKVAFNYVLENLNDLSEVKNTSFTLDDEVDSANINLYKTEEYKAILKKISKFIDHGGFWRDIGDDYAKTRFEKIANQVKKPNTDNSNHYIYKLLIQNISQINFILLKYKEGEKKEVLFNWDFKSAGQDPIVLLSREDQIINMFSSHFEYLWRQASLDHDSIAIKSTSEQ